MAVGTKKAKRRNTDRRREHSRDAARCRRSQESEVFLLLSRAIPLSYDLVKVLDKTSIIRLSISYLKLRTLLNDAHCEDGDRGGTTSGHLHRKLDHLCQRALDGFLMVVSSDGEVLYSTDNITDLLGLTQVDVIGQSLFDLSHPCDHGELREMIGSRSHQPLEDGRQIFFVRMKSTITSKGRNVHIKSASYRAISCTKHLKRRQLRSTEEGTINFIIIIGRMMTYPSNADLALDSCTFVSHHSLNMKFTSCDERISDLIGYTAGDVIGKSLYSYYHALDAEGLERSYRMLFCKGQTSTGLYRFLAQHGGYVWIETDAAIINNAITDKPDHIVCVHSVVSGVEDKYTVFDVVQMASKMSVPFESEAVEEEDNKDNLVVEASNGSCFDEDKDESNIQFATEEILAQVVRQRRDSDDLSLNSINKSLMNEIGDDMGNDSGMTKNFSNFSLTSLLDKMDDDLEMRAPYISMDDRVFGSIDTISSESESNELPLSGLINSDPLLSSANDEMLVMNGSSPLPPPLFVVDILDSNVLVPPQKSLGVKRPYEGTDLSSLPLKMPRVELDSEPSSYSDFKKNCLDESKVLDFDNPSQTVTSQVACTATMTTDQNNSPPAENSTTVRPSRAKDVEFLKGVELPEVLEWKSEFMPFKAVRLVSNDQKQMDVVPTGCGAEQAGQQRNGVVLLPEKTADQTVVAGKRAIAGSGRFVLKLTTPDGRVFRIMSRTDTSPSVGAACIDSGANTPGSGAKQQIPVRLCGKGINQIPADSTNDQHVNRPQGLCFNPVASTTIRLISPSVGKTTCTLPTKKVYTIVRQPVPQGGNADGSSESAVDGGKNCPLHLKVPNVFPKVLRRVTLARTLPVTGPSKAAVSSDRVDDNREKTEEKAEDLDADEAVVSNALPGGDNVQPSSVHLVQKSAAQTCSWPMAATSATTGDRKGVLQEAVSSSRMLTAQLGRSRSRTVVAVGKVLHSDDSRKLTAVKESKQELQQENGGHVSTKPDNHEASVPCSSQPTSLSSDQDFGPDFSGSSVLKNLLLKGLDINYGYRLESSSNLDVAK